MREDLPLGLGTTLWCVCPNIVTWLSSSLKQEGATKEEIDNMPKFKFRIIGNSGKVNGEIQESFQGVMIECDTDSPTERPLSQEDAVSFPLCSAI